MKDRPDKYSSYKMKQEYTPIENREPPCENYDNKMEAYRSRHSHHNSKELEHCTFSPAINKNSPYKRSGSVEEMMKWKQNKDFKVNNERMAKLYEFTSRFQPEILDKSRQMVYRQRSKDKILDVPTHDRLIDAGKEAQQNIEKMRVNQSRGMFRPRINTDSLKLNRKGSKGELLVKKDNGNSANIDFFIAEPKGVDIRTVGGSLSRESSVESKTGTKRRKGISIMEFERQKRKRSGLKTGGRSGASNTLRGSMNRSIASRTSKTPRGTQNAKKKKNRRRNSRLSEYSSNQRTLKKDPYPEYYSPYAKDVMMSSGMPLKKILRKSEIHRKRLRMSHNRVTAGGGKTKKEHDWVFHENKDPYTSIPIKKRKVRPLPRQAETSRSDILKRRKEYSERVKEMNRVEADPYLKQMEKSDRVFYRNGGTSSSKRAGRISKKKQRVSARA